VISFEFKIFHSYAFYQIYYILDIGGLDLGGKKFDVQIKASVFQPKMLKNLERGNRFSLIRA